jgi:hypothetical protein
VAALHDTCSHADGLYADVPASQDASPPTQPGLAAVVGCNNARVPSYFHHRDIGELNRNDSWWTYVDEPRRGGQVRLPARWGGEGGKGREGRREKGGEKEWRGEKGEAEFLAQAGAGQREVVRPSASRLCCTWDRASDNSRIHTVPSPMCATEEA